MKFYFYDHQRANILVAIAGMILSIGLTNLSGQDVDTTITTHPHQIYEQVLRAAMEDGTVSPEEEALLNRLWEALDLGVQDDIPTLAVEQEPELNQSGRWTIMAQNMLWGVGLYGWGIPFVLDVEDFKWIVAGEMFSMAGSLYLTWKYTEGMHLPEARSQYQRYFSVMGLQTAIAILQHDPFKNERANIAFIMAMVPVGTYLGDRLYRKWESSTGQAYATSIFGMAGMSIGSSLYRLAVEEPFDPWTGNFDGWGTEEEQQAEEKHDNWQKGNRWAQLLAQPIGIAVGRHFYSQRQYSFGDAFLLLEGWGGGMMYGIIIADLLGMEDSDAFALTASSVGIGGIYAMDKYIAGKDYSFGQGFITGLGALAGVGMVNGTGVILEIEEGDFYKAGTIVGSLAGIYYANKILTPTRENAVTAEPTVAANMTLAPIFTGSNFTPGLSVNITW